MWRQMLRLGSLTHSLTASRWMVWASSAVFLQRPALPAMTHVICSSSISTVISIRCAPHVSLHASASAISRSCGFSASLLRTSIQSPISARRLSPRFSRSSTSSARNVRISTKITATGWKSRVKARSRQPTTIRG